MISVNNLSLYFGGQDIFKDISFMINQKDKIGLVGKNGVGKTTLLRVLAGEQSPNSGKVEISKKVKIGYLTQDLDFQDGKTVLEEANSAFEQLNLLEHKLNDVNQQLIDRTDYESSEYLSIIEQFNSLEERFRISGGHEIHSNISQVLTGLGFTNEDFHRQTSEFSGGWRMRIELAKILLKNPDVLLLDEPTNHLDIESIIWLERWLDSYTGAIILVSHDRFFLDNITNKTIEISFAKINSYKAPYTKYLSLRKDRIEKQIQSKKNQDKYIRETKLLIDKFRAKKNKAAFAQSLIKKLDRLEKIEVEQEDDSKVRFRFPPAPHSGKLSLLVDNVSKSYGDIQVLKNINLEVIKGEKIAFVGKNGEGKTTLAKIIVNEINFDGNVELGHQVKIGYYAQNQADFLDDNITILQTIQDAANEETSSNIRTILGSFLFSNDEVDKKIKVLSGGERARVSLCKLLLQPYNLLIMDEPTNHLDIKSKELLKKALEKYNGSLIIVSHDREFLQGLTKKVYEFKNQNIKHYDGDIDSFLKEKELKNFKELEFESLKNIKNKKNNQARERFEKSKRINKLKNKIQKLESQIDVLEKEKKNIENNLLDPKKNKQIISKEDFYIKYQRMQNKIKLLTDEWEENIELVEKLIN